MHDLYQLLGVRSGAADDEIKAAFRCLAKQLHPDLNPGDAGAERRFRDAIRAYEVLTDPPSRAAYDRGLARQRALRRWRFRAKATTMLTAFALTVSLGLFWRQLSEALLAAGQYGPPEAATETLAARKIAVAPASPLNGVSPHAAAESAELAASGGYKVEAEPPVASRPAPANQPVSASLPRTTTAEPPQAPALPDRAGDGRPLQPPAEATPSLGLPPLGKTLRWASYQNAGFALQCPADVFVPDAQRSNDGQSFLSLDGRARLFISAALNASGTTPAKLRRSLMAGPYRQAQFDYAPQRGTWFVLSGTLGGEMFYQRVTFSCDGQAFHTWSLVYPLSERTFYDRIVEEVHRRYRHGTGGKRCG
jgi:hypothetical protein